APWLELTLAPEEFDPAETGSTFAENAAIKAAAAAKMTGLPAVADDSGITVDALDGRPGVYSSRYSDGDEALGRSKLLAELGQVPEKQRGAAYVCSMVVCAADGTILYGTETYWRGRIGFKERGSNGFGFDPIFYLDDKDVTVAELPPAEKNKLSHRGQA